MPLFGSGFEAQKKLKPNLKMATQRIAMLVNKKTNSVDRHKRQIVELLRAGKIDKANIKVPRCSPNMCLCTAFTHCRAVQLAD